jgi:hypothetical protein
MKYKVLFFFAIITTVFGFTVFIDTYTNRPTCISLGEPNYFNLEIIRNLLVILFTPVLLILIRYILIKRNTE